MTRLPVAHGRSVKEWQGKSPDTKIPTRVHMRVRDRANERCAHCTRQDKRGQADHIIALINGGENRETNLQWLCQPCHKIKTAADVAVKSIAYGKKVKDAGMRKSSHPIPGSRGTRFKTKMDGTVIDRATGEIIRHSYVRPTTGEDKKAMEAIET